jgi:hypothetical protein
MRTQRRSTGMRVGRSLDDRYGGLGSFGRVLVGVTGSLARKL